MPSTGKRFAREHVLCHRDGFTTRHVRTNIVIHDDRWSLIASPEAGDVANANFFCVGTLKSGVESSADLITSAQVAAHVGADPHVDSWRRAEMKVWIKAGYRVNLTDGDIDFRGKRRKAVGGEVTEITLYGP